MFRTVTVFRTPAYDIRNGFAKKRLPRGGAQKKKTDCVGADYMASCLPVTKSSLPSRRDQKKTDVFVLKILHEGTKLLMRDRIHDQKSPQARPKARTTHLRPPQPLRMTARINHVHNKTTGARPDLLSGASRRDSGGRWCLKRQKV